MENRDVFRPRGQLAKEIDCAERYPDFVVSALQHYLSEERRQRIETVIAHRTNRLSLALDGLTDPHNTAAVIRTADAFGVQLVQVIESKAKFVSSRKVTQGSHKWVDFAVWTSPEIFAAAMKKKGIAMFVAEATAKKSVYELTLTGPTVVVFGNEHEGVSAVVAEQAAGSFSIPMFGFVDSINVSAAAAVTLAALRQGGQGDLSAPELKVLRARFYLRAVRAGLDIVMLELKKQNSASLGLLG